ncbi:MAG: hypothetical protein MJA31_10770 [Clostridia bacterium]|nr:hypothetical protein [Clostridia bacterium]
MKKGYKTGIFMVVIFLIAGYIYYTFPQNVNVIYSGIKYQLGDLTQQEQIEIRISGHYYKRLFATDFFKGSINIENKNYPNLKLLVGEELQLVAYRDYKENGKLYTYGEAFIGEKLVNLTICVQDEKNGWNSEDGFMVSAPAKNRFEALKISNGLMKDFLKHKLE